MLIINQYCKLYQNSCFSTVNQNAFDKRIQKLIEEKEHLLEELHSAIKNISQTGSNEQGKIMRQLVYQNNYI